MKNKKNKNLLFLLLLEHRGDGAGPVLGRGQAGQPDQDPP